MHNDMEHELHPGGIEGEIIWPAVAGVEAKSNNKPVRILLLADITGFGPDYHVGDEAMAEVAIGRLSRLVGADNLVMGCSNPAAIPSTYGIRGFAYYSLTTQSRRQLWRRKPLHALKGFLVMTYHLLRNDIVFVCGGGNLTSQWTGVLESRLFILAWALRLKKRIFLVSQTLGPFTPSHRARCNEVLSRAEWVSVRDRSFSHGQVDFPVHFAVDDAVFLEPRHSATSRQISESHQPALALSMRRLGEADERRLSVLSEVVNKIANELCLATVFVPHHSPRGGGDTVIAERISEHWEGPFTILDPIPSAREIKAITADSTLVVTMRYHQLVFALATGVPAVGIYVNEYTRGKLCGAFEQFGLIPRVVSISEVEDKLAKMVAQAISEREQIKNAARRVRREELSNNLRGLERLEELRSTPAD